MLHRTLFTLGAVTLASLAVFGIGRSLDKLRKSHLEFEFPMEELFV